MTLLRRRFGPVLPSAVCAAVAVAALCVIAGPRAWSQPARIKIIIPFAPGGGVDVVARIVAEQIGNMQGPTAVVENHPGAGTVIATRDVLRATPDGSALLFINNSVVVVPQLRKVDYDPLSSLLAICEVASAPTVVVVNSASPYRTLNDLIGAARAKPGRMTYGAVPGSVLHIGFEMLQHAANMRMTLIPYNGTIPVVTAVLAGQIDASLVDYPAASGQLQAGKLRALALGSARPVAWLSGVPTVAESGFKDYDVDLWYGLFAPAKTPPETASRLAEWFTKAVQAPDVKPRLAAQGVRAVGQCGPTFGAFVRKQYDVYGRAIRDANIKEE